MPRIVEFRNAQDEKEEKKRYGKRCLIKTDRTKIIKAGFFSEKYYYGDYTKMNTYLVNRYQIPTTLDPTYQILGSKKLIMRM